MIGGLAATAAGGAFGLAGGVLIGGRLAALASPGGEHDILAWCLRWLTPLGLAPAGAGAVALLLLARTATRTGRGLVSAVAGDGANAPRLAAAALLGDRLHAAFGRPLLWMRLAGGGTLAAIAAGAGWALAG